jgi:outer membrane protein OmpA-like peptidoglycan-associated protein
MPTPVPTTASQAATTGLVVPLGPDVLTFYVSKQELVPASEARARALAKVLAAHTELWRHLEVAGHADASGNAGRNATLSTERAIYVRKFIVQGGAPWRRVTAKGYGSSELLPGLPANSPAHRRVELRFTGVTDPEALRSLLASALAEAATQPVPAAPTDHVGTDLRIDLDASTMAFAVATADLDAASQKRAAALARALKAQSKSWQTLQVAGHTDGSGLKWKNDRLARARAEALRARLVAGGVDAARVKAKGYGSAELLPGLPANAAEHRRVELRFHGVTDAAGLRSAIQAALNAGKTP